MQMPLAPFENLLADDPACQRSACCQTRSSGCWPPTRAAQPQTARILCPLVVWCAGCCNHGLRGALNTLQGAYPGCSPSRTAPACRRAMPMFNRCRTQRPAATIMRRVLACMKLSGHSSDQASSPATAADATRTAQDFPYMQRARLPCRVTRHLADSRELQPTTNGAPGSALSDTVTAFAAHPAVGISCAASQSRSRAWRRCDLMHWMFECCPEACCAAPRVIAPNFTHRLRNKC